MRIISHFIWILLCPFGYKAQTNILHLNYNYHLDLWKPFSAEAQEFIKNGKEVTSKTWNMNLTSTIIHKPKFSWSAGFAYKSTNFRVKDRITKWAYLQYYDNNQIVDTVQYTFSDPADLIAVSTSYAVTNQFAFLLRNKTLSKHYVGLEFDVYCLEYYDSWYESSNKLQEDHQPYPNPGPVKHFFLSSISTAAFYKLFYVPKDYCSIGLKLSLGSNIYSDWDQFRKYVWMGVGLEIGFGKRRINDSLKELDNRIK
ncbi:MAG: hypothetical protein ACO1O6_10250 [Bacteroidota bacterium]